MDIINKLFKKQPEKTRFQLFEESEARKASKEMEEKKLVKSIEPTITRLLIKLNNNVKVWIPYDITRRSINRYDFTGRDCMIMMEN